MQGLENFLKIAKKNQWIKIFHEKLDVNLEIPHIAFIEAKKKNPKILLFLNPVDKTESKEYKIPIIMNMFANFKVTEFIFGNSPDKISQEIYSLLKFSPPQSFSEKIKLLKKILIFKNLIPKKIKSKGECQKKILKSLDEIPILKMWDKDASKFITAGQVYTLNPETNIQNVGLYRLQKISKDKLIIHWQLHKDGNSIFNYYRKKKLNMPVSIAIGGDPLYLWCAQSPFPPDFFELLFYGFIRKRKPILVKSKTNNIFIPNDADIVIEGEIDVNEFAYEGPFGDHTGFYTPMEKFPIMHVKLITSKENPHYVSTVVGKPPCEDKYMGWATERIFLPFIKISIPEIIDYHMPEAGVFHNLMIVKIKKTFPGAIYKISHALWGLGQMSFLKHVIFVGEDAPELTDYKNLTSYILQRISENSFFISKGIVDQLDHSSYENLIGGKLAIDATELKPKRKLRKINDSELERLLKSWDTDITEIKNIVFNEYDPICIIKVNKSKPVIKIFEKIKNRLSEFLRFAIFIDNKINDWQNLYLLLWRVTSNIDACYDIFIDKIIGVDATVKRDFDGFKREWPDEIFLNKNIVKKLQSKGIIEEDEILNYY